jgi:hypothetical protein
MGRKYLFLNKMKEFKCVLCKKAFSDSPSAKRLFCGLDCLNEHRRRNPNIGTFKKGHTGYKNNGNFKRGQKPWNWKGIGRWRPKTTETKEWVRAIMERDNFTCQDCKVRGGRLEVHHIKPWVLFPELRLDKSNGVTLCRDCHKKTDSYGGKIKRLMKTYANKKF